MDTEDGSVKYVLTGDGAGTIFEIDENSGDIHATRRLDREEKALYTLSAKAVNKTSGQDLERASEFIIKIHDINDNEPKFSKDTYVASVSEMSNVGEYELLARDVLPNSHSLFNLYKAKGTVCAKMKKPFQDVDEFFFI